MTAMRKDKAAAQSRQNQPDYRAGLSFDYDSLIRLFGSLKQHFGADRPEGTCLGFVAAPALIVTTK